ncbi:hypothetical protein CVT25_003435 [Psilocybe cyanescens]|uniref:Uncharacterized protein n=1 Tax=Psilocybe cyanescens TaxID=93625 RepID=A0A409WLV8_PSICY|nr:hypothetical protein CVT25_003435 [Psilocybe cyanescens]
MKIAISAAFISLVGFVASANLNVRHTGCDEASRFGILSVSPTAFHPGNIRYTPLSTIIDKTTNSQDNSTTLTMKFAISAGLLSLAGLVASANVGRTACDEAARFGVLTVSPTTFRAGDTIKISTDVTCGVQNFGLIPQFLDYSIEVLPPNNNGFEQPIVLARHALPNGALSDTFNVKVPHGFFFNATYTLLLNNLHNINGTDGSPVLVRGETESTEPITVIV